MVVSVVCVLVPETERNCVVERIVGGERYDVPIDCVGWVFAG